MTIYRVIGEKITHFAVELDVSNKFQTQLHSPNVLLKVYCCQKYDLLDF